MRRWLRARGCWGGVTLVGCTRAHHGGAGFAPTYIVYLTEQKSLDIIREQLEIAGLNFGATPPNYRVTLHGRHSISIDLYDEEKNVGVVKMPSDGWAQQNVRQVTEGFSQQTDINMGVFYTPREWVFVNRWGDEPTEEERVNAIASNEERLTEQVQAFIELLQEQGILEERVD